MKNSMLNSSNIDKGLIKFYHTCTKVNRHYNRQCHTGSFPPAVEVMAKLLDSLYRWNQWLGVQATVWLYINK